MPRIAVIGSNSFAGAAFVDAALSAGHEVLGINRSAEGSPLFLPYKTNPRAAAYSFRQLDLNREMEPVCTALECVQGSTSAQESSSRRHTPC